MGYITEGNLTVAAAQIDAAAAPGASADVTCIAWVRMAKGGSALSTGGATSGLFGHVNVWEMNIRADLLQVTTFANAAAGVNSSTVLTALTIAPPTAIDAEWYLVAMTWLSADSKVRVYVGRLSDGVSQSAESAVLATYPGEGNTPGNFIIGDETGDATNNAGFLVPSLAGRGMGPLVVRSQAVPVSELDAILAAAKTATEDGQAGIYLPYSYVAEGGTMDGPTSVATAFLWTCPVANNSQDKGASLVSDQVPWVKSSVSTTDFMTARAMTVATGANGPAKWNTHADDNVFAIAYPTAVAAIPEANRKRDGIAPIARNVLSGNAPSGIVRVAVHEQSRSVKDEQSLQTAYVGWPGNYMSTLFFDPAIRQHVGGFVSAGVDQLTIGHPAFSPANAAPYVSSAANAERTGATDQGVNGWGRFGTGNQSAATGSYPGRMLVLRNGVEWAQRPGAVAGTRLTADKVWRHRMWFLKFPGGGTATCQIKYGESNAQGTNGTASAVTLNCATDAVDTYTLKTADTYTTGATPPSKVDATLVVASADKTAWKVGMYAFASANLGSPDIRRIKSVIYDGTDTTVTFDGSFDAVLSEASSTETVLQIGYVVEDYVELDSGLSSSELSAATRGINVTASGFVAPLAQEVWVRDESDYYIIGSVGQGGAGLRTQRADADDYRRNFERHEYNLVAIFDTPSSYQEGDISEITSVVRSCVHSPEVVWLGGPQQASNASTESTCAVDMSERAAKEGVSFVSVFTVSPTLLEQAGNFERFDNAHPTTVGMDLMRRRIKAYVNESTHFQPSEASRSNTVSRGELRIGCRTRCAAPSPSGPRTLVVTCDAGAARVMRADDVDSGAIVLAGETVRVSGGEFVEPYSPFGYAVVRVYVEG